jgi:outer membrane scaffolding protein for murein synthesis (MipA/OmpV family)
LPRLARSALILALLVLSGLATKADAQTPSPLAYWQYSVGQTLTPLGGPVPDWRYNIGGGVMTQPEYEGAKRYQVVPSPVVDIRYRDIAFASDGEGLGVNVLRGTTYRAGIAISYDVGRNHTDDPRLATLHAVGPTPEVKLFGEAFFLPFVVTGAIRQGIVGHQGLIGDFGAYVPIPLATDLYLFAGPSVSIANKEYMHSYFGVTPNQSTAGPQLRAFSPGGGAKNVGFGLTAAYLLTDNWIIIADGAYERLLGDAANSPIVETKSQFTLGLNLVYHF